jgi:hypothetical protein
MNTGQRAILKPTVAAVMGWIMMASLAANVNAGFVPVPVTFADVTDWNTTPMEDVTVNDPLLNLNDYSPIYAGINTLQVNDNGKITINNGFCIDPFHWSVGSSPSYYIVPLTGAPKSPAELNAITATEIEELWSEYYSPTMSSPNAAGLQIAIWELVSSNAVVNDGLPAADAFTIISSYDSVAANDLDSLANPDLPVANLIALTGPGQDYVIAVPDGGATSIMLVLTVSALVLARPALIKSASQLREAKAIPVNRCSSVQGQANCAVRFAAKV